MNDSIPTRPLTISSDRCALLYAWLELQCVPSYVDRFADGRERFEVDDTNNLLVGEQNNG